MLKRKLTSEKAAIASYLEMYDVKTTGDIQKALKDLLGDMLDTMPGIDDFELDKNELLIYRDLQGGATAARNIAPVNAAKPEKPSVIP